MLDWTGDFVVEQHGASNLRNDSGVDASGEAGTAQHRAHEDTQGAPKDFTDDFAIEQDPVKAKQDAEAFRETDPHRVAQRQRQIDFGKNTIGYQRMVEAHPIKSRRPKTVPRTPDVHKKCSKRAFDGLVRQWRRRLHEWDLPKGAGGAEAPEDPRLVKMNDCGKRSREADETRSAKNARVQRDVMFKKDGGAGERRVDDGNAQTRPVKPVEQGQTDVEERSPCGVEVDFAAEY